MTLVELFKYVFYFVKADSDKQARAAALQGALRWCRKHHTHNWTRDYRVDMLAFQRSRMNAYAHSTAMKKIKEDRLSRSN